MIVKGAKSAGILTGIFLCVGSVSLVPKTGWPSIGVTTGSVTPENVLRYVRDRFGVPETTKMTASPFQSSVNPDYYECTITVEDSKQTASQSVSVSKDGHYLAMSKMYALGPDPKGDILRTTREVFKLPPALELTVGAFRKANVPNFFQTTVTADDGKKKQAQLFFVTKDNRYVVLGSVFPMMSRSEILRSMSMENQPSVGHARAAVTIVEYADLQCPACARMHAFLEKELLPKYGDKVRVIFKEFPLVNLHDWAYTAALANECAYQIDPAAFLPYRSMIFQHQSSINAANSRDELLAYGEQAGIDHVKLAACIDSKASVSRVEKGLREGQAVGLLQTPTFVINGEIVSGLVPKDAFYKAVDEALQAASTQSALRQRPRGSRQ